MNNQKSEKKTECYLIAQSTNLIKTVDFMVLSINRLNKCWVLGLGCMRSLVNRYG
jgi:hypothetical protein